MKRALVGLICAATLATASWADVGSAAHSPSQNIVDKIREAAGAEIGLIAAGMIKEDGAPDDLLSYIRFKTDEIAVMELKGSQIRAALEKSVTLYPDPYDSFLQVSNLDITFKKAAMPDSRVVSVNVEGEKLTDTRVYTVAMPATMARGVLGFFKIWKKDQIKKTLTGVTLESLLQGKAHKETAPRWKVL